MALRTRLTEKLRIRHPVLQAPMGGSAGGSLAAAVSAAGGLGLIGAGRGQVLGASGLDREFAAAGNQRVGCGFGGAPAAKARLAAGRGEDTVRTRIFDIVNAAPGPVEFTGRALASRFSGVWHGRESELDRAGGEKARYAEASQQGDFDTAVVWGGEAIDLSDAVEPAAASSFRASSRKPRPPSHGASTDRALHRLTGRVGRWIAGSPG